MERLREWASAAIRSPQRLGGVMCGGVMCTDVNDWVIRKGVLLEKFPVPTGGRPSTKLNHAPVDLNWWNIARY